MTTNSTPRLSRPQQAMLARLGNTGEELTPGGTRDSGRDASAWHRTLAVLVRLGLASRASGSVVARITPQGRAWLASQAVSP